MRFSSIALAAVMAAALVGVSCGTASASFTLQLQEDSFSQTFTDQSSGATATSGLGYSIVSGDSDPTQGSLSVGGRFGGTAGDFNVNITASGEPYSNNDPGNDKQIGASLSGIKLQNLTGGAQTLTVTILQSGLSFTSSVPHATLQSILQSATFSPLTVFGSSNDQATLVSSLISTSTLSTPSQTVDRNHNVPAGGSIASAVYPGDPGTFSLQQVVTITLDPGDQVSITVQADAIAPEPGTLAIFASGLPLLGLLAARRRRKTTIAA